ncbi:hypothetical protein AQUCO_00100556v1 [Aquilegia coerulea]|uniref:Uncharacterized protein n=1 Tax=Aquilegia coerulea TaxID=218851 RepID=A0A2G5FB02_AQUCA|nr:hypothetical protein AQUCO_00100556v1 [Aquilegia coerulea]
MCNFFKHIVCTKTFQNTHNDTNTLFFIIINYYQCHFNNIHSNSSAPATRTPPDCFTESKREIIIFFLYKGLESSSLTSICISKTPISLSRDPNFSPTLDAILASQN